LTIAPRSSCPPAHHLYHIHTLALPLPASRYTTPPYTATAGHRPALLRTSLFTHGVTARLGLHLLRTTFPEPTRGIDVIDIYTPPELNHYITLHYIASNLHERIRRRHIHILDYVYRTTCGAEFYLPLALPTRPFFHCHKALLRPMELTKSGPQHKHT
jgi:hypothetical protein